MTLLLVVGKEETLLLVVNERRKKMTLPLVAGDTSWAGHDLEPLCHQLASPWAEGRG